MLVEAPDILDPQYASLARELAQAIRDAQSILEDYGFSGSSDPAWIALSASPDFRRMLDEAQREWNAADTSKRRIQLKAQASIEIALPEIHGIITNEKADHADRINAAKLMKSLAGMDPIPGGGAGGEGSGAVVVKINIGAQQVVKSAAVAPKIIDHEDSGV